ncbi:MAG TPA: STAS domain-containing protein [Oculatellaceae cyanobacterium]
MSKESATTAVSIAETIGNSNAELLNEWVKYQLADESRAQGISDASLRNSSTEFLKLFQAALKSGDLENLKTHEWETVQRMLSELSASRAIQGSSPSQTAKFIFSLKQPLFDRLNAELKSTPLDLAQVTSTISTLIDKLGLYTTEAFSKTREAIIRRQQKEILEMSTPVLKIWDGIVAVPLIGTLDSARTQIVMESLLQKIVETSAKVAILDITGVPTVDTQTAQHLIKTVSATRLMGAECIISGIRPQIAQTIVHLGIDIYDVVTRATMADALKEALSKIGWAIRKDSDDSGRER